jgi:hypothetical protein
MKAAFGYRCVGVLTAVGAFERLRRFASRVRFPICRALP